MHRILFVLLWMGIADAREIHVRGDAQAEVQNGNEETPYASINAAIKNAGAGDTIRVHPVEGGYPETVSFHGHPGGEAGRPLTLDGQGSLLIGADVVPPEGWELDEASGVYKRSDIRRARLFLLVDGEMIFDSKKRPENMQPGEWCLVDEAIHYKPPAGKNIEALAIKAAVRANGVQFHGATSHVIVKNFTAQYFWNDGYNIHGEGKALEFYNCNARDMGDEGFSAHGKAETVLDGAVYVNCDNGIFNANTGGKTVSRNVIVHAPRAIGFGFSPRDGSAEHTLENAILIDCPRAFVVGEKSTIANALVISNLAKSTAIHMDSGATFKNVAISGEAVAPLNMSGAGPSHFSNVTFNTPRPMRLRPEKSLDEAAKFEASAFPSGAKIDGPGNREFETMSNAEFLNALREEKFTGPSAELLEKAEAFLSIP